MFKLKNTVAALLVALFVFSSAGWAQGAKPFTPDFPELRPELEGFQEVIQKTLVANLQGPMPVLSTPKGTYLPDYGAVFQVEGNMYEIRAVSPFSQKPLTQQELDEAYHLMLKRVDALHGRMLQAIADHGSSLQHLKPEETLAVVVYLFNGYLDPNRPCPSQLIFRVKKAAISEYQDKKISLSDFTKRIEITRF
jgi:hypothetical protein